MAPSERSNADGLGVALLFRRGARPDAGAVSALAGGGGASVVAHDTDGELELVLNGLAFDLVGLGGPSVDAPAGRHRIGLEQAELGEVEAVSLVPGPHLAEGRAMLPVVRSQLALALRLCKLPGLLAVAWAPAQSWMAVDYFERTVSAWLEGGPFPALGLTALTPALDGGMHSEGLAFFTGQELRIEPELAEDRARATQLAVRIMNQLVTQDPIDARHEFAGPDGSEMALEPSPNGKFVRVRAAD